MRTPEGTQGAVPLSTCDQTPSCAASASDAMRLVDAMGRVEPTWVEAVAVVQAVSVQLEPGQAPPALDDIMFSPAGMVSFPPSGPVEAAAAITAVGRLLAGILRQGDCPMPVWEAMELSRRSPLAFGSVRGFGESLTCFPARQGPQELAAYFQSSRRLVKNPARPATAVFGLDGLTARALLVILAVTFGGVGAGMSVGALLATRTAPPANPRMAAGTLSTNDTTPLTPLPR